MTGKVEVDVEASMAYLLLSDQSVARTSEVAPGVLIDLDEFNVAVGIEVNGFGTRVPMTELTSKYHVRQADLELLKYISPCVSSSVAQTHDTSHSRQGTSVVSTAGTATGTFIMS